MYKIKYCPFCGGMPYLETGHRAFINGQSTRVAFVRCAMCNARSPRFKLSDYGRTSTSKEANQAAIDAWNNRSGSNKFFYYRTKGEVVTENAAKQ